jgi:hypothetical protein
MTLILNKCFEMRNIWCFNVYTNNDALWKIYALGYFIKYFSQGMELHIKGPKQFKCLNEL